MIQIENSYTNKNARFRLMAFTLAPSQIVFNNTIHLCSVINFKLSVLMIELKPRPWFECRSHTLLLGYITLLDDVNPAIDLSAIEMPPFTRLIN